MKRLMLICLVYVAGCGPTSVDRAAVKESRMNATRAQQHGNRLADETSPYLRQHADNPVHWFPWGDEAFDRAQREDKPVFLSIGYSACHWCHVMEHESFENQALADLLNKHFISIKVDREERPEIDELYMTAVQMMTGSGGWPLSVFLTPDRRPFFGGTYFPPEDRAGRPGFRTVLDQIATMWEHRRGDLLKSATALTTALREHSNRLQSGPARDLNATLLERATAELSGSFDATWGGFGGAPKFPPAGSLQFLMRAYCRTGDAPLASIVKHTLNRMAAGGMYDHLGGGFHRYTLDGRWRIPHFEKMLYDNALLSLAYLEAFQLWRDDEHARIVRETLGYVLRDMTSPDGGFYASEDADSGGTEGGFYTWTRKEIESVLDVADTALACAAYGVEEPGWFEERNILYQAKTGAELAAEFEQPVAEIEKRLAVLRERLLKARSPRTRPARDDKIIASWNGMAISALAHGYQVLGEDSYRAAAEKAGQFVLTRMMVNDELRHSYARGRVGRHGYLEDYALMANAFVDLYESTFDSRWLAAAVRLADGMLKRYSDPDGTGFFRTAAGQEGLLVRTKPYVDASVPSGNSAAAIALLRLSLLTGREDLGAAAEGTISVLATHGSTSPRAFPYMLCAAEFYLSSPQEIAIVGSRAGDDTKALLDVVRTAFVPNKVVAFRDTADMAKPGTGTEESPLLANRSALGGVATAYVCEGYVCKKPLTKAKDLDTVLRCSVAAAPATTGKRGNP